MTLLTKFTVVALVSLLANANPSLKHILLAAKYAPQLRFHTAELYWPSTVEFFFKGVKQVTADGTVVQSVVTAANVDDPAGQGADLFLSTNVTEGKIGFLRGQNPKTSSPSIYTFIAPKANSIVDLYYWLFTPFNEGKFVTFQNVGEIGDHVGDWERLAVRTVNGIATQVDYHAHDDIGSTLAWDEVPKFDNGKRPVGYVSKGSHGIWPSAGTFTYYDDGTIQLQDLTSDGGVKWDTQLSQVYLLYPDTYSKKLGWLNYKGKWGTTAQTDCWFFPIAQTCEIVAGPPGPLRDDVLGAARRSNGVDFQGVMKGPFSQTLGRASSAATSSFTLDIDASVHYIASLGSYSALAVQQTCVDEMTTVSITSAWISLTNGTRFTITPGACKETSFVSSYVVGLCNGGDESCIWSPSQRPLRAYAPEGGITDATAIIVVDLDEWEM